MLTVGMLPDLVVLDLANDWVSNNRVKIAQIILLDLEDPRGYKSSFFSLISRLNRDLKEVHITTQDNKNDIAMITGYIYAVKHHCLKVANYVNNIYDIDRNDIYQIYDEICEIDKSVRESDIEEITVEGKISEELNKLGIEYIIKDSRYIDFRYKGGIYTIELTYDYVSIYKNDRHIATLTLGNGRFEVKVKNIGKEVKRLIA